MRLRLLPENTAINFFGKSKYAIWLSILAVLISFVFYLINGLNYGIDFRGGTMLMIKTSNSSSVSEIRKSLNNLELGDTVVTKISDPTDTLIGNPKQMFLIKIEQQEGNAEVQNNMIIDVKKTLSNNLNEVSFLQTESVGSKISGELVQKAILAVCLAVFAVLFYIWVRFEWQFSLGAVIALVHDVFITIGIFSIIGLEFNLSIIAALLTIVGYSLNDTVIVFDRIRENLKKYQSIELLEEYINSNKLIGNYKLKRGCIVNNLEYESLNYKPYKIFINVNSHGNIKSITCPFNIIDLFNTNNFSSLELINPKLILNKVTVKESKTDIINDKNITNNITYETSINVPKNYEDILNTNVSFSFTLGSVVSNSIKQNLLIGFTRNNIEEIARLDPLLSSEYIFDDNNLPSTGYLMRLKNTNYFETLKDYLFCSVKLIENDSYYEIAFNAHDNYRLDYQSLKPYNEDIEYKICLLRNIYGNDNDTNGGYLLFDVIKSDSYYIFKVKKRYIWDSNTKTYVEEENSSVLNYFLNLETINSNKEFILSNSSYNFSVYESIFNFSIPNDNNPKEIDYFINNLSSPSSIPSNIKDDIDNNLISKYKSQLDSDVEVNNAIDDIFNIVNNESNNIRYSKDFYLTFQLLNFLCRIILQHRMRQL